MKTRIKTENEIVPALPFPKLMSCVEYDEGSFVVLFYKEKTGTVVHSTNVLYEEGRWRDNWDMAVFKDLPKNWEVILSN